MAERVKHQVIQAPQYRYLGAEPADLSMPLALKAGNQPLEQFDLSSVVNLYALTQQERNASKVYRIHGTVNHISFLNNRPASWDNLTVLYDEVDATLSFDSQFDLRVCYVAEYESVGDGYYRQWLAPLTSASDVDWLACGFAQNTFREKLSNFVLSKGFDLTGLVSTGLWADLPITELYLLITPKQSYKVNTANRPSVRDIADATPEGFAAATIGTSSINDAIRTQLLPASFSGMTAAGASALLYPEIYSLFKLTNRQLTPATITQNKAFLQSWFGTEVKSWETSESAAQREDGLFAGDIVLVDEDELTISTALPMTYQMSKQIKEVKTLARQAQFAALGYRLGSDTNFLTMDTYYEVQAFYPLKIQDYSAYIETGKEDEVTAIPSHALLDDDGLYHWRDLLDVGYPEIETGRGVEYPFINGVHYYYTQPLVIVRPDLSDYNTFRLFHKAKGGLSPLK